MENGRFQWRLTCYAGFCYIPRCSSGGQIFIFTTIMDLENSEMQRQRGYLGFTVLLLTMTGCHTMKPLNWNWINFSSSFSEWNDDDQYMTTWHEKHGSLVELRRSASGMSLSQQASHALALSAQIKQEQVPVMRREMVRTLAAFDAKEAETGLETALSDADVDIRVVACQALAKRKSEKAFDLLLTTVRSDMESDVRVAALRGLGNFSGKVVFEELTKALVDRDPAIQFAGIQGLRQMTGEDWGEDPETWIAWTKGESPEVIYDGSESLADSLNPANFFR